MNWREELNQNLVSNGESWKDVIAIAFAHRIGCYEKGDAQYVTDMADPVLQPFLNREFDGGYGCSEGDPFTMWTHNYVYFPTTYDGSEDACSVPRQPVEVATRHIGGE